MPQAGAEPAGQRHARTIILSCFRSAGGDRRGDTRCRVAGADTIILSLFVRAVSCGRGDTRLFYASDLVSVLPRACAPIYTLVMIKKRFIGSIMVTHTHYSLNNSSVIPPFVSKCNSADYPPPRSFTLIISIVVVRSSKTTISPLPTSIAWVFLTLKR